MFPFTKFPSQALKCSEKDIVNRKGSVVVMGVEVNASCILQQLDAAFPGTEN